MVNEPLPVDTISIPEQGKPAPKPEKQGHLRVLANGAVYDTNKKRIVANPGGGSKAFTSESAAAAVQLRMEQKRAAVLRGANAVAMQGGGVDGRELHGDMAYVEAISEAMTMKALTVNDPKAVDAARFIFNETGIAEAQAKGEGPVQDTGVTINLLIAQYITQLSSPQDVQLCDTVDGEVREDASS